MLRIPLKKTIMLKIFYQIIMASEINTKSKKITKTTMIHPVMRNQPDLKVGTVRLLITKV